MQFLYVSLLMVLLGSFGALFFACGFLLAGYSPVLRRRFRLRVLAGSHSTALASDPGALQLVSATLGVVAYRAIFLKQKTYKSGI